MKSTGNTILITGGGSGIGRALAESFHALGNQVIIAGRRQSVLDEVTRANPGMASLVLNIEESPAIGRFATQLLTAHPKLNVVVHNAGIMKAENLREPANDVAEATVATNLLGPIRLNTVLLPHLLKQANAAIMTVTSGLAFVPMSAFPTYCATKAALHSYTESLRQQLRDTSVQVLEWAPPYVQTELISAQQASDPHAMPLKDFISESMQILIQAPDAPEILVERVKPLRFAQQNGNYAAVFQQLNPIAAAASH